MMPSNSGSEADFGHFEVMRRAANRRQSIERAAVGFVVAVCLAASFKVGEVDASVLLDGLSQLFDYFSRLTPKIGFATLISDVAKWYWGFGLWSKAAFDTIVIAFLSTAIGTIVAIPLSFLAARNLVNVYVYNAVRRTLELIRTVPVLVYALIFVLAFGLGPLAGVIAMALHSTSSLGKLFSEVNEGIDRRPLEGIQSAGGDWFAIARFSVWPQVLPTFVSYILLRLEKNIRGATVIGFVGAGGIGQELYLAIRSFQYADVSAISLMIILIVIASDVSCDYLRRKVL